jgi:hypothetical protein
MLAWFGKPYPLSYIWQAYYVACVCGIHVHTQLLCVNNAAVFSGFDSNRTDLITLLFEFEGVGFFERGAFEACTKGKMRVINCNFHK